VSSVTSREDGEDMGTKKDGGMTGRKNIGVRQRDAALT